MNTKAPSTSKQDDFGFSAPNTQPSTTSSNTNGGFWTATYWSGYFQIDSADVGRRISAAVLPTQSFLDTIGTNPDLYGPFWIPTTVIFALFSTSTIAESIAMAWSGKPYTYDMLVLSTACATVYPFVVGVPLVLWGTSKYLQVTNVRLIDLIVIYGYGMALWVPVSLLCVLPSDLIRWLLVLVALVFTTFFKVKTIHPLVVQSNNPKASNVILPTIIVCQVALAILFKLWFFQHVITVTPP